WTFCRWPAACSTWRPRSSSTAILAARNILVGERNCVKVADFGLSRAIGDYDGGEYMAQQGAKFPIKWTSPEAALFWAASPSSRTSGPLASLSTRWSPMARNWRPDTDATAAANCSEELYDIMLNCWDETPEERPTFAHLAQYFEDFFPSTDSGYRATAEKLALNQIRNCIPNIEKL
uniref:Protein kinase domain-containing protein n=1 Tax=Macrostomum lignano TaxID=282301 RepID=A0A1I8F3Q3_9PLAT